MSAKDVAAPWWHESGYLERFVGDLLSGELALLRPGRSPLPLPWEPAARFEEDLGVDSLERLRLATALAEAIHLHRSGIEDGLLAQRTLAQWVTTTAHGLDGFSAELTFRTSGSTGQPKWCVHKLAELQAEITYLVRLFADGRRVISAVPSHHIYGFLFTILLPSRLDANVLDMRAHAPSRLSALLAPGDIVIGHPDFWRAFVRAVPQVGPGVIGVTSTGPCPPEVAEAATGSGIARFIDVYGSSETAGIGWRADPHVAYELFPYWRRGVSDAELIRTLVGGDESVTVLPDRLVWDDERHVRPAGRLEGAVQVGGVNVHPERIAAVLRKHPAVADVAVRLMRPAEGDRLKAFVVPRDAHADTTLLQSDLWSFIDLRFSAPERPKSLVFGSQLPLSALGKNADWPIEPEASRGFK